MTTHKSFCRNCAAICGIELEVENNKITSLLGDQDNPMSQGYYCIKASASQDLNNGEDRLPQSQKRNADGSFKDIGNEQAMDEIAARLKAIIDEHGPESVALYYGTGIYYNSLSYAAAKPWIKSLGVHKVFSSMTVDQSAMWVTMGRMGMFPTGKYSIHDTDLIVLAGANPAVAHNGAPVSPLLANNPMKWMREAEKRGCKVVVVDPRKTETARYADEYVAIKPGEDTAFFGAIIKWLFDNDAIHQNFTDRFAMSVAELRESVQSFTLDYASKRTGVPASQIETVAKMIAESKKGCVSTCTGVGMSPFSNLAWHMLEAVNVLRGFYAKAGDNIYSSGAMYTQMPTMEMVIPPNRTWEQGPKLASTDIGLNMGEYPTALLTKEIMHKGKGGIKALFVVCGNPAAALGDPDQVREAFSSLDLMVTMDVRMTETGKLSDYIMSTKTPYERHDMTFMDGFHPFSYGQFTRPVLEPNPEMKEDWEVMAGISKRLNTPFIFQPPALGFPHPSEWELDLENLPTSKELLRWCLEESKMDADIIMSQPSGYIREEEPIQIEPAQGDDGARLDICPADVAAEIQQYINAPDVDEAFPYRLTCRRHLAVMNGAFIRAEKTKKQLPGHNVLYMNPEDLGEENIDNGAKVTVTSKYGSIELKIKADPSMSRGIVATHHNWGTLESDDSEDNPGAHVGRLVSIDEELQSINYMPVQSGIAVQVAGLKAN